MPVEPASFHVAERAATARARADERLSWAMDDLFLPEGARLEEATRVALARLLNDTVGEIEAELRRQAMRLLTTRGAPPLAVGESAATRLTRAGLLRDDALIEPLIARVRLLAIAAALPIRTVEADQPSLLVRLTAVSDRRVADAARALLVADGRESATLAADVQHRLVWSVAAAIRPATLDSNVDRAIAEAAVRSLAAYDEGAGAEAAAMRLAIAIDARPDELAALLLEALGDRRLSLFVAVLARAVGLEFAQAEALVLEPEGDRLWLALRAAQLDRATIARVALALGDADPRRDIEAFADELDRIVAIDATEARLALAPEMLDRDFRAAIRTLARIER